MSQGFSAILFTTDIELDGDILGVGVQTGLHLVALTDAGGLGLDLDGRDLAAQVGERVGTIGAYQDQQVRIQHGFLGELDAQLAHLAYDIVDSQRQWCPWNGMV
ncbi:hypothetical protein [Bifidobacterium xylocopae]|uniref:Uncharacterized protein n=1 Tax=Bifidobacterium xylocopae TaxID=2493119 RepID=A0A366KB18_9BIFI|nr:hypothetical protein [Bifidobacterium xylocopae]RBP98926.1 hypothetical protein CRD59_06425 [Bifidobacterium xylocopae]